MWKYISFQVLEIVFIHTKKEEEEKRKLEFIIRQIGDEF
jgi:hypothetical protein